MSTVLTKNNVYSRSSLNAMCMKEADFLLPPTPDALTFRQRHFLEPGGGALLGRVFYFTISTVLIGLVWKYPCRYETCLTYSALKVKAVQAWVKNHKKIRESCRGVIRARDSAIAIWLHRFVVMPQSSCCLAGVKSPHLTLYGYQLKSIIKNRYSI